MGLVQPGGICEPYYQTLENTELPYGEIQNSLTTIQACQSACDPEPYCFGYAFTPPSECTVYNSTEVLRSLRTASKTTDLYIKLWMCMGCIYQLYPGYTTNQATETLTVDQFKPEECLMACQKRSWCVGVEHTMLDDKNNCLLLEKPKHIKDMTSVGVWISTYQQIFCWTDPPCNGPPPECVIRQTGECVLPEGATCGVGKTKQIWYCKHDFGTCGNYFHVNRYCCSDSCPSLGPCNNPTNELCDGRISTAEDCWKRGCCWVTPIKRVKEIVAANSYTYCKKPLSVQTCGQHVTVTQQTKEKSKRGKYCPEPIDGLDRWR